MSENTNSHGSLAGAVAADVGIRERLAADGVPRARAELAWLRSANLRGDSFDVRVLGLVFKAVPTYLSKSRDGELGRLELAALRAMVLHAQIRQGSSQAGHTGGARFGAAISQLALATNAAGVERRFQQLCTATNSRELAGHLNSLIGLLRGTGARIDFGHLASDIAGWDDPQRRTGIRNRWARDFEYANYLATRKSTNESNNESKED